MALGGMIGGLLGTLGGKLAKKKMAGGPQGAPAGDRSLGGGAGKGSQASKRPMGKASTMARRALSMIHR